MSTTTTRPGNARLYRRVARRETHSPKSTLAIVIAAVIAVSLAYLATEIVLDLVGAAPLLVAPADMAAAITAVPALPPATLITAGAIVAVIGLVLFIAALTPGRRPKHLIDTARTVSVVDNEVIASAIARGAAFAGDTSPDNVRVSVSRRLAVVDLTPASGRPVDRDAVERAVSSALDSFALRERVTSRIRISDTGKVGA